MIRILVTLALLVSFQAQADFSTTIIPGIKKDKFEAVLKREMNVSKVEILEIKEIALSKFLDWVTGETVRIFKISLSVRESFFSDKLHGIKCTVEFNGNDAFMYVKNCKSATSTVSDMELDPSQLN